MSNLLDLSNEIGDVNIGLKDNNKLKKIQKNNVKCQICYTNKINYIELPCKHEVCEECSITWFESNKKCPICNIDLE